MASYDPVSPEYSVSPGYPGHQIPRKRVGSELVDPSPVDEKHAYAPVSTTQHGHSDQDSQSTISLASDRFPLRWWSLEILSLFAAAGCLGGIVALLVLYEGRPQNEWSSDVLTLNGLVALLATLCRTFFMVAISAAIAQGKWNQLSGRNEGSGYRLRDFALFDDASKGPWGSLQLIWRFKGLHIACLGAALSILSLAFSVFSQQMIDIDVVTHDERLPADRGRVSRATTVESIRGYGTSQFPITTTKMSIYNGYMATEVEIPPVTCATGNCKWPIIPTVGVCGACVDTTDRIRVTNSTTPVCVVEATEGLNTTGNCMSGSNGPEKKFVIGPGSGEVFSSVERAPENKYAPSVLIEFGALGILPSMPIGTTINNSVAAECALWYCVQAREVEVVDGELRDEIVDTWSKAADENFVVEFVDIPPSFNIAPGEPYTLGQYQVYALQRHLNETVHGNVTFDGGVNQVFPENDFSEGMFNAWDDVHAWIDRIASSMTNEIRSRGNASYPISSSSETPTPENPSSESPPIVRERPPLETEPYRCTMRSNQVIFTVHWLWLIYPAGMVLLALVYLIFEATRTSFLRDVRAWKDDSMVPLCINLDERLREAARTGLGDPKGARDIVGGYDIRVVRGENGFPKGFVAKEE